MTVAESFSAAIEAAKHPVLMLEHWKPYKGMKISNCGRAISHKGRELKPQKNRYGYLYVQLKIGGKRRNLTMHRLVAQLFVENPLPLSYNQVNHIFGLKHWNRADCLEHCNHSHNERDKFVQRKRLGLPHLTQREQERYKAAAEAIKKQVVYGGVIYESVTALAAVFGVTRKAISNALRRGFFRRKPIYFKGEEPNQVEWYHLNSKAVVFDGILYPSLTALAKAFGVCQSAISNAVRRGTWRGKAIAYAS